MTGSCKLGLSTVIVVQVLAAVPVPVIVALGLVDALVYAFGQHHGGEVKDRGRGFGNDRRIDDPQSADPHDGADRIHDGPRVGRSAHGGGGARGGIGGQVAGDERGQVAVVGDRFAGSHLAGEERGEVRAAGEVAGELDTFQHPAGVTAGGKEVAVDQRGGAGVAAGQLQRPGGLGQDHRGGQRDHSAGGTVGGGNQVGCRDVQIQFAGRGLAGGRPQDRADRRGHLQVPGSQRVGGVKVRGGQQPPADRQGGGGAAAPGGQLIGRGG